MSKVTHLRPQAADEPAREPVTDSPPVDFLAFAAQLEATAASMRQMLGAPAADASNADLLYGVPAIAEFLGIRTRQVHHQIDKAGFPVFRMGGVICARRSTVRSWIAAAEAQALRTSTTEGRQ